MIREVKAPRPFRFSLASLLIAVTLITGFMGYFQLRRELMKSHAFMQSLLHLADMLPFDVEIFGLLAQLVSLVLAATLIYFYRQPKLLLLYLTCHTFWFAAILLAFLASESDFLGRLVHDAILCILFFEPTLGLVIALVAWSLVIAKPKAYRTLMMTILLILSLIAEILAMLALNAFAAAIGAAIAASSR